MTDSKTNKISRRDALKILTAATGAAALANLPSKWSKPGLEVGVLPAHAQTSVLHILLPPAEAELIPPDSACYHGQQVRFTAEIAPPTPGIMLQYALAYVSQDGAITSPVPPTGSLPTNASGQASVIATVTPDSPMMGTIGLLTVEWSFVSSSVGSNTVSQDVAIEIGC